METGKAQHEGEMWGRVLSRENLMVALERVKQNQGAPGVDGMTVAELPEHLQKHWPSIRTKLETGRYRPSPVKRVEIPKPGGGQRKLGIPIITSYCTSYRELGDFGEILEGFHRV
jgi:RNA-directed DNA polymerase